MNVDFQYFLNQKYNQLKQQADATTLNAKTNALTGAAAARLDNTRATLLPAESAASIGKTKAETGLIGEQAKVVGPEAAARIVSLRAGANRDNTEAAATRRRSLTERSILPASIDAVRAGASSGYQGFRFSDFLD